MTPSLWHHFRQRINHRAGRSFSRLLARRGYRLVPSGKGYLDAATTAERARQAGLSICEYLESQEHDLRKRGRRDRIISAMQAAGCFDDVRHVTEIGTGTGMYLERVMELAQPAQYEVYETAPDWRDHLRRQADRYAATIRIHDADGESLSGTPDNVSDLVHAHGVLVYLSTIETFAYLKEMARVCRPGGLVVFDCYLDTSFSPQTLNAWIESPWRFPVVLSERLLAAFCEELGLRLRHQFTEIHGASRVDYQLLQKKVP